MAINRHRFLKVGLKLTLSVIMLNMNCLNIPKKRHKLSDWIKKPHLTTTACKKYTVNIKTQQS